METEGQVQDPVGSPEVGVDQATEQPVETTADGIQEQQSEQSPADAQATQATQAVFTTSDGKAIPKADVEKLIREHEELKTGYQREYTRKRMAETSELKELRGKVGQYEAVVRDARALESYARTNPELWKTLTDALAGARAQDGQVAPTFGNPEPSSGRREIPPEIWEDYFDRQLDKLASTAGIKMSVDQRAAVFAKLDELEEQTGTQLPPEVAFRYVMFDAVRAAPASFVIKPQVRPTLKGGAQAGVPRKMGKQTDEEFRQEMVDLMKGR